MIINCIFKIFGDLLKENRIGINFFSPLFFGIYTIYSTTDDNETDDTPE